MPIDVAQPHKVYAKAIEYKSEQSKDMNSATALERKYSLVPQIVVECFSKCVFAHCKHEHSNH